ncbi:MAG: chloride channel protein [Clostridia bacterium]|nr:chloride channel protein [Clostridia bacterium]
MGHYLHTKWTQSISYIRRVLKLLFLAAITGGVGGLVGVAFHASLEVANTTFDQNTWLIWLLPVGGILIVLLHVITHMLEYGGTDEVIDSVRTGHHLRFMAAPVIFIATCLTHLFGGSAGREGAALQLGGSIGVQIGKRFAFNEQDMHLATLCGMSAFFSALFCTPLTAVFFAVEVISVGVMYYVALLPCMGASLLAYSISLALGAKPITFSAVMPSFSGDLLWKVAILGVLCALVSILFCVTMRETSRFFKTRFANPFVRITVGALAVILLTLICQTHDYNGAGMSVVYRAVDHGETVPTAWIWKMLFTAITIGCGFKGGEIVPTLFVGATFGCLCGPFLGMDPSFAAAVGMIAVFCGAVNCPVTSILLSVELFGTESLLLFSAACIISYILSGTFSLYHAQKIVYSKLRTSWINQATK